jgi:predicted O-methyltransferase YrrM
MELLVIAALAEECGAKIAFEIGTADGRTTLNIADNIAAGGTVYTLNLPLEQDRGHLQRVPIGHHFLGRRSRGEIRQLWGDSKTFDFSPYEGRCQLLFIDGDHFEPGVTIDSQTALRLTDRENGVILWHDALRFDVQRALPRFATAKRLPIHLISNTNLAALFFSKGAPVVPLDWVRSRHTSHLTTTRGT